MCKWWGYWQDSHSLKKKKIQDFSRTYSVSYAHYSLLHTGHVRRIKNGQIVCFYMQTPYWLKCRFACLHVFDLSGLPYKCDTAEPRQLCVHGRWKGASEAKKVWLWLCDFRPTLSLFNDRTNISTTSEQFEIFQVFFMTGKLELDFQVFQDVWGTLNEVKFLTLKLQVTIIFQGLLTLSVFDFDRPIVQWNNT